MKDSTKLKIRQLIENVITQKINKYTAETNYVPFHEALFEKKVILQTSKLHSLWLFELTVLHQLVQIWHHGLCLSNYMPHGRNLLSLANFILARFEMLSGFSIFCQGGLILTYPP